MCYKTLSLRLTNLTYNLYPHDKFEPILLSDGVLVHNGYLDPGLLSHIWILGS